MSEPEDKHLSRRQFIPGAAGVVAVAAAGVAGYAVRGNSPAETKTTTETKTVTQPASATTSANTPATHTFVTEPDLHPQVVNVVELAASNPGAAGRFVMIAPMATGPKGPDAQIGPMIVDRQGRVIWYNPRPGATYDFTVQTYKGEPTLTWWEGTLIGGHGIGVGRLVNSSYEDVATIEGQKGPKVDLHELHVTAQNTVLITSYDEVDADLRSVGGPKKGKVYACHAQEIDVATGKILFDWDSTEHLDFSESYATVPKKRGDVWDYCHMNAVSEMDDGNLLIGARNTWCAYKVNRQTGAIMWRLGGKRSDFKVASDAQFQWQHDARPQGASGLTVFDNGDVKFTDRSKGLLLSYDESAMTADLVHAYEHPAAFLVQRLGSVQILPDDGAFVGWGIQPYFSQFNEDGSQMLLDGNIGPLLHSYRTFLNDWVGKPKTSPAIVAQTNIAGGFFVYASWNGATEIDHWDVLAGTAKKMKLVASSPWEDFETMIAINSSGPKFQVVAYDQDNNELGRSEAI